MEQTDACLDIPSSNDYSYDNFMEFANGEVDLQRTRPFDKERVYNQWSTPACTRYALTHICNANNILEYGENWQSYEQLDPITIWTNGNKIRTLQAALEEIRWLGLIEGYTRITTLDKLKDSIDKWMFIYTGSDNWDWKKTKERGIYTLRTD